MASRPKVFLVDASCDDGSGFAGVAVVRRDRDMVLIASDVVLARDSNEGELRGIVRALELAAKQGTKCVVWTDSGSVVGWINKGARHSRARPLPADVEAQLERARELLESEDLSIERRGRDEVHPAHVSARQALRAWLAGRRNEPTLA